MISKLRMRHCFNCGAALGVLAEHEYDPLDTCGRTDCEREARYARQAEEAERRARAEDDGFDRYR